MEIVLKNTKSKYLEIFSLLDLENIHETFKRFSCNKEPLEAKIFVVNESINSYKLSKLKNHFGKINIYSLSIYSNNRDTIISGKSLKIDSAFIKEQEMKNKLILFNSKRKTIFFTKEQYDRVKEYLQMETYALLETLIQEQYFPLRKIFTSGANY